MSGVVFGQIHKQLWRVARLVCGTALLLSLAAPAAAGEQARQSLSRGDSRLELHISEGFGPGMQQTIRSWIEFTAGALAKVYGRWPRSRWRIEVAPVPARGDDPIPWGQVNRGQVDSVQFYIFENASYDELIQAWTVYHELAHLLIPYRGWGDTWFSEGLASYYQNLLRARAGVLSERAMWQKLHDGFQRGRGQARFDGRTLADVSDSMRREGGFMRVYWSGAWYFFNADSRLRRQSGGRQSLDLLLGRLNECCADRSMSVPQIVRKLDELAGADLFEPLYRRAITMTTMPEFESLFADLGMSIVDGKVRLQDAGPAAGLRRQIAQPGAL